MARAMFARIMVSIGGLLGLSGDLSPVLPLRTTLTAGCKSGTSFVA